MSQNDRDLLLRVKLMIPERIWRLATKPAAWVLKKLPETWKYQIGLKSRANRYPYKAVRTDDVVFQIGAPSDLLFVGRSRAGYFAHLVSGTGKLVVMEPDPINCQELEAFAKRCGIEDRVIVVPKGGWHEETVLSFYQSREHPASAVMSDLNGATPEQMERRGYTEIKVPVTTVDSIMKEYSLPTPRLISITTNGAEQNILLGMKDLLKNGPDFISLAIDDSGYREEMAEIGYEFQADDDRGFTFRRAV